MTLLLTKFSDAIAGARDQLRHVACMYLVGGPVGVYHTVKLARGKRRIRQLGQYIDREKELHREHLRTLHHELTQAINQQQSNSIGAAQFWNWCEKKAGVQ